MSETLASLKLGERARVVGLSDECPAADQRRMLDLGLLPGTLVEAELRSPGGDPTAYRIREALIALRRVQASMVLITREESP